MLFLAMFIHVASLGADQLSLGATSPPSSDNVSRTCWWISGNWRDGSGGSASQPSFESVVASGASKGVSEGRTIPSARK